MLKTFLLILLLHSAITGGAQQVNIVMGTNEDNPYNLQHGSEPADDRGRIVSLLKEQVANWNAGNISGYMHGYWESDSLVFIGKNGPTYGYAATLARYQKSYPDKAAMGKLTSTIISMERISEDAYFVIGKWALDRVDKEDLSGSWTLLFRKKNGKWVIVCDHSS